MKIVYNYNQVFELLEIDMWNNTLIFKTNDGMKKFENSTWIDYKKSEDGNIIFKIEFDSIDKLNVVKELWEYLTSERLLYLCD